MNTRVLAVSNAYPDSPNSYHGIFIRRTVEELGKAGYRSLVLVPRIYSSSPSIENFATHSVRRFPFPTAEKLLIEYENTPYFRLATLIASGMLSSLRPAIRKEVEIIHAHWAYPAGLIAAAAAKLTGKPLVLTLHGSDYRLAAEKGGLHRKLFAVSALAADHLICVSEQIADFCSGELGIPNDIVTVQPVGVDTSVFYPDKVRNTNKDRFTVISTRNLQAAYRVDVLIRAAAMLTGTIRGLKLVIAGAGPERERLERLAHEQGLSHEAVEFSGTLSQPDLAGRLRDADLYVSTSPVDGASASLLEALACGLYPVVTDIPANRSWIRSEADGLLYTPENMDSLSEKILFAYNHLELIENAAKANPGIISSGRASLADSAEKIAEIYRKLAAK